MFGIDNEHGTGNGFIEYHIFKDVTSDSNSTRHKGTISGIDVFLIVLVAYGLLNMIVK